MAVYACPKKWMIISNDWCLSGELKPTTCILQALKYKASSSFFSINVMYITDIIAINWMSIPPFNCWIPFPLIQLKNCHWYILEVVNKSRIRGLSQNYKWRITSPVVTTSRSCQPLDVPLGQENDTSDSSMVSGWCPSLYFGMVPVGTVAWPEREDWKNCELVKKTKICGVYLWMFTPKKNRVVHRFWHNMGFINKTEWFCHEKWWFYQHKICFTRQAVDFTCSKRSSKERRNRIICRSLSKSSRSQKAQKMSLSPCSHFCATAKPTSDKAFASTCGAACTTCCSLMQTKGLPNVALLLQGDGHQKAGRLSFRTRWRATGCCFDRGSGRVLWAIQRTPKSSAKGESYAEAEACTISNFARTNCLNAGCAMSSYRGFHLVSSKKKKKLPWVQTCLWLLGSAFRLKHIGWYTSYGENRTSQ